MTYTLMSVPEDKEVWCTGFRFDDTRLASIASRYKDLFITKIIGTRSLKQKIAQSA